MTRFYKTDPNRTSGKIKLTPPVDSYTIVLQVLTLSTTQTTRGWFQQTSFLGGVECSNGGFRPCEGPGLARISGLLVDSLIMLARRVLCWFCYISATKEPAQPCNLVSGLQSWSASILRSISCPPHHPQPPPLYEHSWYYFARPTAQIFYLIWRETLQAATSTGSGLKGNRLMHLLCKFHTRVCYPWRVMLASIL